MSTRAVQPGEDTGWYEKERIWTLQGGDIVQDVEDIEAGDGVVTGVGETGTEDAGFVVVLFGGNNDYTMEPNQLRMKQRWSSSNAPEPPKPKKKAPSITLPKEPHPGLRTRQRERAGFSINDFVTKGGVTGLVMSIRDKTALLFLPDGTKNLVYFDGWEPTTEGFDISKVVTPGCVVRITNAKSARKCNTTTHRLWVVAQSMRKGKAWKLLPVNQGLDVPYESVTVPRLDVSAPIIVREEVPQ